MELDRNVSEYMQSKNMLAMKIAGMVSAQLLLVAVFFCALSIVKIESGFNIIKAVTIILSMLLTVVGVIITIRYRNIYELPPDDIGLRQSADVINYAYDIAKPVLMLNMMISGIVGAAGLLAYLIIASILLGSSGVNISRAIFFVFMAVATYVLIPSLLRKSAYIQMMSRHIGIHDIRSRNSIMIHGVLLSVLVPSSVCIYLLWRHFGNYHNETAWIIFCLAGITYGTIITLSCTKQ